MNRREALRYGGEAAAVTALGTLLIRAGVVGGDADEAVFPPSVDADERLLERCIKCGRCVQVCPTSALTFADVPDGLLHSGVPILDPENGGCIAWNEACLDCVDACPTDALRDLPTDDRGRLPADEVIGVAQVDAGRCINCSNCDPVCPTDAIREPGYEDRETFSVDTDRCPGCGRCVEACPVDGTAIELYPPDEEAAYPVRRG
ncbi:4Fe-4S binding protein [Salinilacihabitans rarus]|uniref:4Fe-4S binding protein n=1 Tax=Salinilacihabitans rarus TaxID=2961596 RepID=UPI0020C93441|nr:4Fe-4S binding protein [Salinilacihabitans rarus]